MQNGHGDGSVQGGGWKYIRRHLEEFNNFLRIRTLDLKIIRRYQDALRHGEDHFVQILQQHLLNSPAVAQAIGAKEGDEEEIKTKLTQWLLEHLAGMLAAQIDKKSAKHVAQLGKVLCRCGIEPMWILGAYLRYLDHFETLIRNSPKISDAHRSALEDSVTKLLFRDMGLLMQGYWGVGTQPAEG